MAYTATDQAAIDRLGTVYNGDAYDAEGNPGGLAAGGHRVNLVPAFQDVASAANAIAAEAAVAANAVAATLGSEYTQATSTTSLSLTTGTKTLTVEPGKAFLTGMPVRLAYDADTYMDGEVTSYTSATGSLTVKIRSTSASGQQASWAVYLVGGESSPPDATIDKAGKAELATQAEVDAGEDDQRIVTPRALHRTIRRGAAATFESGTLKLDVGAGYRVFTHTSTANVAATVLEGAPATGWVKVTLRLTNGGAFDFAHPANIQWAGGAPPTLTASGTDVLEYDRSPDGSIVDGRFRLDVR